MKNVGDKIMVEVIIDEVRPEGYFTSFDGDKPSSVWVNKKFVEEDPPPVITLSDLPAKLVGFLENEGALFDYLRMPGYKGYTGVLNFSVVQEDRWIIFHDAHSGLYWSETPQGHDWWNDLNKKWRKYLKDPALVVSDIPKELAEFLADNVALQAYLCMPQYKGFYGKINYDTVSSLEWISHTGEYDQGFNWGKTPQGNIYWEELNSAWLAYSSPSELPARLHSFLLRYDMLVDYVRSTMSVSIDYNIVPEYDWVLLLTVDLMEHNNFYNLHKMWVRELYESN